MMHIVRGLRGFVAITLAGFLTASSLPAQAASTDTVTAQEESPKWFSSSLGFGSLWLEDPDIAAVYEDNGKFMSKLTMGFIPWSRYIHVEIDMGLGFLQFPGKAQFADGSGASADSMMLTLLPLSIDLLIGIDIAHEQPVVPYGGIGLAWTLWRENESGDGEKWYGDRMGWSGFFGLGFLLDRLEPDRAARVDAKAGINDSYLTVEGRYSTVDRQLQDGEWSRDGLSFSGWSLIAGVKLAY